MAGHFDDLDELAIERPANDAQPVFGDGLLLLTVELVTMPMALVHNLVAVESERQ